MQASPLTRTALDCVQCRTPRLSNVRLPFLAKLLLSVCKMAARVPYEWPGKQLPVAPTPGLVDQASRMLGQRFVHTVLFDQRMLVPLFSTLPV
jgi:hypothetical protein